MGSASLAAALTTTTFSDRQLGVNKVVTVPMWAVWLATGNGLVFRGDLGRRVIPIDMDARVEHPEDRHKFQYPDLLAHVRAERSSLVAASLTILRAFHLAGRPQHGGVRVGSFEAWDDLVRGACIWAGLDDPAKGRARIRDEGDLDLDLIRAVYTTWRSAFADAPTTTAEVVQIIARNGDHFADLRSALAAIDPQSDGTKLNARTIGTCFRQWKGRIVAGLRLERLASKSHGAAQWVVTTVAKDSGK